MMKMNDMSNTPITDEIIKYCDYQFPATQGHIPLRTMIEKIEKENAELRKALVLVKLYSPIHKDDRWASLIAEQALNNTVDNKNESQNNE